MTIGSPRANSIDSLYTGGHPLVNRETPELVYFAEDTPPSEDDGEEGGTSCGFGAQDESGIVSIDTAIDQILSNSAW